MMENSASTADFAVRSGVAVFHRQRLNPAEPPPARRRHRLPKPTGFDRRKRVRALRCYETTRSSGHRRAARLKKAKSELGHERLPNCEKLQLIRCKVVRVPQLHVHFMIQTKHHVHFFGRDCGINSLPNRQDSSFSFAHVRKYLHTHEFPSSHSNPLCSRLKSMSSRSLNFGVRSHTSDCVDCLSLCSLSKGLTHTHTHAWRRRRHVLLKRIRERSSHSEFLRQVLESLGRLIKALSILEKYGCNLTTPSRPKYWRSVKHNNPVFRTTVDAIKVKRRHQRSQLSLSP